MRQFILIICALLLVGCSRTTGPSPTPGATTVASPARTAGVPVRRASAVVPRPATATPALPQMGPRDGAALVTRAVGLLLNYGVAPETSGVLYGAAYDGTVGTLRRAGYTVDPAPPPFTDQPVTDEARFTAAYLRLAGAVATEFNQTSLAYEAIRAATDRIDECNTYLLEPAEYARYRAGLPGSDNAYAGVGIDLQSLATIAAVYPGTPAEQAGLRAGDVIVAIGGQAIGTLSVDAIGTLLRGPEGSTVQVTIQRPGESGTRAVSLTRARVQPPALSSTLLTGPGGQPIGYLRLDTLTPDITAGLDRALASFAAAGATRWVLDLRESQGEPGEALAAIAGRFIRDGRPVAYRQGAIGDARAIATAPQAPAAPPRQLAVLINGGTSGVGEVLAAALRDYGLARLFGEATAGCVSISAAYPLAAGAGLRIGIAQLTSPQHRPLAATGQQPDETILSGPAGAGDAVLEAAMRWAER